MLSRLAPLCDHCGGSGRVFRPDTVLRRIERAVRRIVLQQAESDITIRVHPEVALHILEDEPDFLRRQDRSRKLQLDLRDDPLMRQDEFRLLAGQAETDVTSKYALG